MDDLIAKLRGFGQAYPESMFPPVYQEERNWLHQTRPGLQDRIAGAMGRHFAKFSDEAADALAASAERIETLTEALRIARAWFPDCERFEDYTEEERVIVAALTSEDRG